MDILCYDLKEEFTALQYNRLFILHRFDGGHAANIVAFRPEDRGFESPYHQSTSSTDRPQLAAITFQK